MIYLYDEYVKAFPTRPLQALNKFKDSAKNLHEMSLDEINQEVLKWERLKRSSIEVQKGDLIRYLEWIKQQGIKTNPDIIRDVTFPTQDEKYLIYSTIEIHALWNKLLNGIKRQATIKGNTFSIKSFLVCYVAGILSFYGLTKNQILSLTLSDVQEDGIIGYDIKFTAEDVKILMQYKNLVELENGKRLVGYKYIRSVKENVDERILRSAIGKADCTEDVKYLKKVLTYSNLFVYGVYNRIFNYEMERKLVVQNGMATPKWFIEFVKEIETNCKDNAVINDVTIVKHKKAYIFYRTERKAYANVLSDIGTDSQTVAQKTIQAHKEVTALHAEVIKSQNNTEVLVRLLDNINRAINETDKTKAELMQIKKQISDLVK